MLPFLPPFVNQNQVQRGKDPPPNLFTSSSSAQPNQFGFNDPQMLMPTMGSFNNQNAFLCTLFTQQHMVQGLQNNLMGVLLQQWTMPQLPEQQLNWLGALQNPNFMSLQHGGVLGRPQMDHNLNQMLGFSPNGLLVLRNPIFPPNAQLPVMGSGSSNPGLLGNGSVLVGKSSKRRKTRKTRQKLQEPKLPSPVQNIKSNNGRQGPQPNAQLPVMGSCSSNPGLLGNGSALVGKSSKRCKTRKTRQKLQEPKLPSPVQNIKSNNGRQGPQLPVMGSGSSNPGLLGNGSALVGKSSKRRKTQQTRQKLQEPKLTSPVQNIKSNNGRQGQQMTHGQTGGKNFSSNSSDNVASNNFNAKLNEQEKMEPSHMRFQKSQSYNSRKACKKTRRFSKNNRRGQHQRKGRTTNFSASNTPNLRKRPLSVVYSESKIQQWREARKNYFPTRANMEKKLNSESANKEEMDSRAKICWQQLKEVLAKQAELGVKVADIPSTYLTKPEDQNPKIKNKKRCSSRRKKRNVKRLKLKNEDEPSLQTSS